MQAVLDVVLPVFGLIFCGWVVGKSPLLSPEGIRGINNFVFWVCIPALLFRSMGTLRVPETVDPLIIPAYFSSCLIVFFGGILVGRKALGLPLDQAALLGMGSTFGNTVLAGIPLILLAFGEQGLVVLLFIVSFHPLILITLPTAIIELARGERGKTGQIIWSATKALMSNPVILGMLAGLAWRVAGLELWGPAETFIDMLRNAATPAALFAVGATLTTFRIAGNVRQSLVVVVLKLVAMPALVWVMTVYVFQVDRLWASVATVCAALPTGVNAYLLASMYDTYVARTTTAILISTVLSIVTVGVLIGLLAPQPV